MNSILIFLFLLYPSFSGAGEISPQEYQEIKAAAFDIVKRFPPTEYEYVAVGRSPTPVFRMLEEMGEKTVTIPISQLKYFTFGHMPDETRSLVNHFKSFLGPVTPKKKILLVDFAYTGQGLESARQIMDAATGKPCVPYTLNKNISEAMKKAGVQSGVLEEGSILHGKLMRSLYDRRAKYPQNDFDKLKSQMYLGPRKEYDELGEELRQLMEDETDTFKEWIDMDCTKKYQILGRQFSAQPQFS